MVAARTVQDTRAAAPNSSGASDEARLYLSALTVVRCDLELGPLAGNDLRIVWPSTSPERACLWNSIVCRKRDPSSTSCSISNPTEARALGHFPTLTSGPAVAQTTAPH